MKLGFFTACLGGHTLEEVAEWAAGVGFETLELAAWPKSGAGYSPCHLDVSAFDEREEERVRDLIARYGLSISSLGYYENSIVSDSRTREDVVQHLRRLIDAASVLGVEAVGTFVGGNHELLPKDNIRQIGHVFRPLAAYAEDRGVKLMIENCPMLNWQRFGLPGNFAYSPELWDALFEEIPSPSFGLNLDPSHLHWLGIDITRVVVDYADRIFHAHAKDTEMLREGRYRFGVLANQLGDNQWVSGWWRYRIPGRGEIDWTSFIETLLDVGYEGVLSIEHEDPELEGTPTRVMEGLTIGLLHLRECRLDVQSVQPA